MARSETGTARFAYVGCFTTEQRKARGKGIALYRIDAASGDWTFVEAYDALHNPHFLALDAAQRVLYSAHGDCDRTAAWSVDPASGRLALLGTQPTGGDNSSTVMPDPANRWVVLSTGPGIAVYPIMADGSLGPATDNVIPPGETGPWRREQHGPHPHQATFDPSGRYVIVPDKGLDRIHVYRFDAGQGKLVPNDPPGYKTRYGAIPRHIAFHPHAPYAYLVNEMDSTVVAQRWDAERGTLEPFQRIPTTPDSHVGDNTGAEIAVAPSGRYVYASNRGHDSIAIYSVDAATGRLDPVGWESTQGRKPRFFTLDASGERLYAANENGHTIVEFRVDTESGRLAPTGRIVETGSPACIVFVTR